ncbi:MAG: xanthine dehydrogenase family protein molybdopterin-binding subunit [Anaerolineales bacterium]
MNPDSYPRPIGGNATRIDALDKVTGEAKYVEDISMPGMLYARVFRCPYHHAELLSIDPKKAKKLPGVIRVITADDIPGINGFPEYSQDEPLLVPVGTTAKMKGAPIALIVAETPYHANKGMQAINAEFKVLPHNFEVNSTASAENPSIYPNGNLLSTYSVENGDLEESFSQAEVILEATYHTSYQEHSALERESAFAYINQEDHLFVLSGTHEPHWQRNSIADTLGVDRSQVRFITPHIGGSFGGKQDPWPHIAVSLIAYLTQKPVRLTFSRKESFLASPKRHPYDMQYKVGLTQRGILTGLQAYIKCNTGAYDADGYYIPEYASVAAGGAYRWQAVDIQAQSIYTNGPKCGQYRGFGTPQSTFALECVLDEIAENLDEDPINFRLKNVISQGENTFLGYPVAESLGYQEVLETLQPYYQTYQKEAQDFNDRNQNKPYQKGVGVAGMWYRFGKSGSLRIEAHAELASDGHFVIYCSVPDYGQGISTVMVQLGAQILGISRDQIELVNADTGLTPDSGVQGASRATYWVGNAVIRAVQTLRENIFGTVAETLDCDPADLTISGGEILSKQQTNKRISLTEVAKQFDDLEKPRKVAEFFDPSPLFPEETRPRYTPHFVTGAHLAEVLVDIQTGDVRVTRYIAVHDAGKVINQPGAEGQIEGAVLMGIGAALKEQYLPDITTGFSNYILPMVNELPEIKTIFVEVPSWHGPFGAKGLGETAMLPSTPAVINAVSRAIGTRIREIPATPERIVRKLLDLEHI